MTWLDFVVLTLAASAVVDVWFNGSLFAKWRALINDIAGDRYTPGVLPSHVEPQDSYAASQSYQEMSWLMQLADHYMPDFVAELLSCSFCFSYHAPWMVGVVFFSLASLAPWAWLAFLFKFPVYSLAATRLGNLINAWAPTEAQYEQP